MIRGSVNDHIEAVIRLQKRVPLARAYLERVKQLGLLPGIQPLVDVVED